MLNKDAQFAVIVLSIIVFIFVVTGAPYQYLTRDTTQFVVSDKERIVQNDGPGYYLVFTEEGEVLKNSDALFSWKFNSSDLQGAMKIGSECTAKVYGWRAPFLSMYRNILDVKCTE